MSEKKVKKKVIRYDYSNAESQKLFEEFTLLLSDLTSYIEEMEISKLELEERLRQTTRMRNIMKIMIGKLVLIIRTIIFFLPSKLIGIIKK